MKWKLSSIRFSQYLTPLRIALSVILMSFDLAHTALIPVGSGGYTTDLPAGRVGPSDRDNRPVSPKTTSNFSKPPQSNQWWSSLIFRFNPETAWSENMFAHPLSFKAQAAGLEVGYPTAHFVSPFNPLPDGTKTQEYHYPHAKDLLIGIVGLNSPDTKVANYTDWTVTAAWTAGGKNLQATMGSGLPFVYVTQEGGNALISFAGPPTIWSQKNEVIGATINGHHYGIFAPLGSTWTRNGNDLQSNLGGKNYYSVALLPDNQASTLELFRKHAYAFVTNTEVSWNYNQGSSELTSSYKVQTTLKEPGVNNSNLNRPLLALARHQWLNSKDAFLNFTYANSHGMMKVVDASQFTTKLTYSGVLPFLPNFAKEGIDSYKGNQLYDYIDTVFKQPVLNRWGTDAGSDTYGMGKALARVAHLVPLADQVKHTAARDLFIAEIKTRLEDWFDGKGNQLFYYDEKWRTLIGYPAGYNSDTQLNDHHFHYGYYIMAAAIVANYDPAWAEDGKWGSMVEMLIKDAANGDRQDPQFPFLRNHDVYMGHGWASGAALFGSGNNEESSSEDINFRSALILWGAITENKALRDLGIFLYATAVSAIPQYWFDVDSQIFPVDFQPNTLGIVWSDGGAYATWFGGPAQFFHGINFLPIHPGMLYLGRYPDYLSANQAFMLSNGGSAHADMWRDIHMNIKALYNPKGAVDEFNQNLGYSPETGETKAHTYHWIHNLNQLGRVDSKITADISTYAVFKKEGVNHHVAYNPTGAPVTVIFSDGVKLTVPSRAIMTDDGAPPPPGPDFTEEAENAGEVIFTFKPNWTTQYVKLSYKINGGALKVVNMTPNNKMWKYTVSPLKSGDLIDYFYTYEEHNSPINTAMSQHKYQCGLIPPPGPEVLDTTDDYILSAERAASNVSFVFTSDLPLIIVDIHYKINGGGQINFGMQKSQNKWSHLIAPLKEGDEIAFNITYIDDKKVGHDTKWYKYMFHSN